MEWLIVSAIIVAVVLQAFVMRAIDFGHAARGELPLALLTRTYHGSRLTGQVS